MKVTKPLGTALLALMSLSAHGQFRVHLTDAELNAAGASKMLFASIVAGCGVADSLATMDIEHQVPFLLLAGGIAPVVHMPTDTAVERKFQFHYHDYGCSSPEEACVLGYNQRIFAYLTEKYGKKWMKAVRPDVVGFRRWKRDH